MVHLNFQSLQNYFPEFLYLKALNTVFFIYYSSRAIAEKNCTKWVHGAVTSEFVAIGKHRWLDWLMI